MTWKRARSEEQIAVRIKELVGACAQLYETMEFDEITFAVIAREAGWTRSNLYKYFRTREEILVELLKQDLQDWCAEITETFPARSWTPAEFAEALTDSYLKHERMLRLLRIMHDVLEKNCSLEKLTDFKRAIQVSVATLAEAVADTLPFRNQEALLDFLFAQIQLVVGSCPSWKPTEKQAAAMEATDWPYSPEYFIAQYTRSVEALLVAALK